MFLVQYFLWQLQLNDAERNPIRPQPLLIYPVALEKWRVSMEFWFVEIIFCDFIYIPKNY